MFLELQNSSLNFNGQHSTIFPRSHPVTLEIILHYHENNLHTSHRALLAIVRSKHSPNGAKKSVTKVYNVFGLNLPSWNTWWILCRSSLTNCMPFRGLDLFTSRLLWAILQLFICTRRKLKHIWTTPLILSSPETSYRNESGCSLAEVGARCLSI